jgi:hypothetical protein
MIEAEEIYATTGYGISTSIQDNNYPILKVDCNGQRVIELDEVDNTTEVKTWTFEEYIKYRIE